VRADGCIATILPWTVPASRDGQGDAYNGGVNDERTYGERRRPTGSFLTKLLAVLTRASMHTK